MLARLRSIVLRYRLYRFMPPSLAARLLATKPTTEDIERAQREIRRNKDSSPAMALSESELLTYAISELNRFRELLAACYAGPSLYRDDGELQDTSAQPHIDFRRDSADEIQRKMRQRAAPPRNR